MKTTLKFLVIFLIALPLFGIRPSPGKCQVSADNDKGKIVFAYSLLKSPNTGNTSKALKLFKEALAKDPNSVTAHMGVVYARLYQFTSSPEKGKKGLKEALHHVNTVLKLNPKLADAYKKKSFILYFMGKGKNAALVLKDGMKRLPHSESLIKSYLILLLKSGEIEEAKKAGCSLKKSSFKNLSKLHIDLGNIWLDAGYTKEARECFTRSISEHESPEAWASIGISFIKEKNWQKAIRSFEWALNADPEFYDVYYELAYCYRQKGNLKKAISWLSPYTEAFPDDIRALMELSALYEENGNNTRARLMWMKVKTRTKSPKQKKIALIRIEKLRGKRNKTK